MTPFSSSRSSLAYARGPIVCVDLAGTLVAGDLLWESFVSLVKQHPWTALKAVAALWRGKASFKQRVAAAMPLVADALPFREEVVDHLRTLSEQGAHMVLATASDQTYADAVADHLGIFAEVVASDGETNLSGHRKAAALVARYGANGFQYLGNDWADVPVWQAAGDAIAVAPSARLKRHAARTGLVNRTLGATRRPVRAFVRALRPHQWVKNLLVFMPLIASHKILQPGPLKACLLTFGCFSLCASAIYLVNDIIDIPSDRRHPRKRRRPFAAGELGIPGGLAAAAVLLVAATALAAAAVSWSVAAVLLAYVAATSSYSLFLKRKPVSDVFTLTGLYLVRIVAGGMASQTFPSSWLLGFALFLFLSLAFVKRYTELLGTSGWIPGRAYGSHDAQWMHAIGTSSGYMAVLVLALYVNAPEVSSLYSRPQVLWMLCPVLLFWITRLWFRAGRRDIHDDPVVEAIKDWVSYVAIAVITGAMLVAL
jgi:4-hydroxybenzoate polyprenyltransferase/phosphoserine phosphatase